MKLLGVIDLSCEETISTTSRYCHVDFITYPIWFRPIELFINKNVRIINFSL